MSLKTARDADVYREKRNLYKHEYRKYGQNGEAYKKPYSPEEDALIVKHEMTDRELAAKLGRQISSIQIRRTRLVNGYTENGHIKGYIQEKNRRGIVV